MQLSQTPTGAETDIEKLSKMTFASNKEMLQHLESLGCDISRIKEENGILMCPAGGKPGALMYGLSEMQENGRIKFDVVSQFQMDSLIAGLKKTADEWADEDKTAKQVALQRDRTRLDAMQLGLGDPLQVDYSQLPGCEGIHRKTLEKKMEGLGLSENEVCGILRKRVNGRDWYLDTTDPLISEKNKEGYQGTIPIITNKKEEELLINEIYREGSFVVARIDNNEIVELFNESNW